MRDAETERAANPLIGSFFMLFSMAYPCSREDQEVFSPQKGTTDYGNEYGNL